MFRPKFNKLNLILFANIWLAVMKNGLRVIWLMIKIHLCICYLSQKNQIWSNFYMNFNFSYLCRIWILCELSILISNFNFDVKFLFWCQISILVSNFNFDVKFQFWCQISILESNLNFVSNLILYKLSTCQI